MYLDLSDVGTLQTRTVCTSGTENSPQLPYAEGVRVCSHLKNTDVAFLKY